MGDFVGLKVMDIIVFLMVVCSKKSPVLVTAYSYTSEFVARSRDTYIQNAILLIFILVNL
jgi:hypothetical protein